MKLKDQLRFVRNNMKKNKSRLFMTVLASAMGCAFLIVLASVAFGLQKSAVDDITEGKLATEINIYGKHSESGYTPITDKEIAAFKHIDGVKTVTHSEYLQQEPMYRFGSFSGTATTVSVDLPSEKKAGFELSQGRMPKSDNEVVVGFDFAKQMHESEESGKTDHTGQTAERTAEASDLLGQTLSMEVKQFVNGKLEKTLFQLKVVGIGKDPTREWLDDQRVLIGTGLMKQIEAFTGTSKGIIDSSQAPNAAKGGEIAPKPETVRTYDNVNVYATDLKKVKSVQKKLEGMSIASHSIANELDQLDTMFLILKTGLVLVGTIAVIIASIGIYNTMTMAVTERSQDIGIMKAIGANPKTIKRIFLIEGAGIGLLGAVIGTLVSFIVSYAVNLALPIAIRQMSDKHEKVDVLFSYIPPALVLVSVAICLFVAILSGLRPAVKATKVDVLKALRRDV